MELNNKASNFQYLEYDYYGLNEMIIFKELKEIVHVIIPHIKEIDVFPEVYIHGDTVLEA